LQEARGLALDLAGSVYVAGYDFTLASFSPLGEEAWTIRRGGPTVPRGRVAGLAFDGWDGLYLAGPLSGDFQLVKYSLTGKRQ
jgi:hypothetical protein